MALLTSTKSTLFDGVTQYATGGDVLNFEYNDPFSISCWYKGTVAGGYFVSKRTDTADQRGWGVATVAGGQLGFYLVNTNGSLAIEQRSSSSTLHLNGLWHHLAFSYDGGGLAAGVTIYVDGSAVALAAPTFDSLGGNTIISTAPLNLASRADGIALMAGSLDEVAVYNKELTAAEVKWVYNAGWGNDLLHAKAPSNLMSWWRMGENGTPPNMPDEYGPCDLTLVNTPTIQSVAPTGSGYASYYNLEDGVPVYAITPSYAPQMSLSFVSPDGGGGGPTITKKYKMRAQDDGVPLPGYVTWVVSDSPDFAGVGFPGGTPTPVGSMIPNSAVVADMWEE